MHPSPLNPPKLLAGNSKSFFALDNVSLLSKSPLHNQLELGHLVITLSAVRVLPSNDVAFILVATDKETEETVLFVVRLLHSQSVLRADLFQVNYGGKGFHGMARARCLCLIIKDPIPNNKWLLNETAEQLTMSVRTLGYNDENIPQPSSVSAIRDIQRPYDSTPAGMNFTSKTDGPTSELKHTISNFLRFVFGLNEIKATSVSIRAMVSTSLTCAEKHVDKLAPILVKKLDGLEQTLTTNFRTDANPLVLPTRPHRPSISKTNRTSSYSIPPALPNNITPCIDSVNNTTTNVLMFLLQTIRVTNLFSISDILTGFVSLVGLLLVTIYQRVKTVVHTRLTKTGRAILEGLRGALFTPIASWKVIGFLPKKQGWTVRPLDIIAFILAFLVNLASYLVEGGIPARIAAFDYKVSLASGLKDSTSIAAFTDIKDYIGISINTIKALQIPTDVFAEPEVPEFGWGELIFRMVILSIQFPRNKHVPGYNKRVALFACWASETITYHLLLLLNLGHILISSRTLATVQLVIGILGFALAASMHWIDLRTSQQDKIIHARRITYLSFSSCIFGSVAGFAGKAGVIMPDPSIRAICAVLAAAANKGNGIAQTTAKVHRKYRVS